MIDRPRRQPFKGMILACFALALIWGAQAFSAGRPQAQAQAQTLDDEYTKRILASTPDKRILTELVDHLPLSATVPSPLKFFGYVPGENSQITYHKDIVAYYRADRIGDGLVLGGQVGPGSDRRDARHDDLLYIDWRGGE